MKAQICKTLLLIGTVLTLSQANFATDYYMTPSGAGSGNGSSWPNALSQSQMDTLLDATMQPGDVLHLGSGTYTQAIHFDSSGTPSNPKRISGESTGAGLPTIDSGTWSRSNPASGPPYAISFGNGISHWTIENLVIQDAVRGIRTDDLVTSQCLGITLRNLTIRNCEHPLYIFYAKDWLIENVRAREYSKHGFRFDHNCSDIAVRNCIADLSGGDQTWYADAEQFPFGFLVDTPVQGEGPSSNISFEDCLAQHHHLTALKQDPTYWNGDGFVVNQGNTGVFKFTRCRALDNEDGGFDMKGDVQMNGCVAFQNKRNFRFHSGNVSMTNCVSGYPQRLGGCCSIDGVWVHDAIVTMNFCTIHGSGDYGVEEDSAGQVILNNSIVSFTGSSGTFTTGGVTLTSSSATYRPGAGVNPQYVNPQASWTGIGTNMNSTTYGTSKGYFQDSISTPGISDHQISQTLIAPAIDGLVDSIWSTVFGRTIGNVIVGSVADDNDLSGSFRTLWDTSNLYVLVEVRDATQQNDSGAQTWNDDSVEVYVDANNDKLSSYGITDYQYRFTWTGGSLGIEETKHAATTGVSASRIVTANGYTIEAKLPWSTLAQSSPGAGAMIGLDVHINDDDDGGGRDGKRAWFNTLDTSWQNPATFGTARLVAVPADHEIVQTDAAPSIDGNVETTWSFANRQAIATVVVGSVANDSDLSGSFRILWDASNLYVLVQVTDDAQRNDSGTQTWNDDSVEIYIDANNEKPSVYGSDDYQYRFTWTGTSLGVEEIKHGATSGVIASRVATANGYTMEVKLPWNTLAQSSVMVGSLLGLDVHINDDDDGGSRDGKKSWFNSVDTSWFNPSTFATARLLGIR